MLNEERDENMRGLNSRRMEFRARTRAKGMKMCEEDMRGIFVLAQYMTVCA